MSIGRAQSINGRLVRRVVAATGLDTITVAALKRAAERDKNELATMDQVLSYCLKLGVEAYLDGQSSEDVA